MSRQDPGRNRGYRSSGIPAAEERRLSRREGAAAFVPPGRGAFPGARQGGPGGTESPLHASRQRNPKHNQKEGGQESPPSCQERCLSRREGAAAFVPPGRGAFPGARQGGPGEDGIPPPRFPPTEAQAQPERGGTGKSPLLSGAARFQAQRSGGIPAAWEGRLSRRPTGGTWEGRSPHSTLPANRSQAQPERGGTGKSPLLSGASRFQARRSGGIPAAWEGRLSRRPTGGTWGRRSPPSTLPANRSQAQTERGGTGKSPLLSGASPFQAKERRHSCRLGGAPFQAPDREDLGGTESPLHTSRQPKPKRKQKEGGQESPLLNGLFFIIRIATW